MFKSGPRQILKLVAGFALVIGIAAGAAEYAHHRYVSEFSTAYQTWLSPLVVAAANDNELRSRIDADASLKPLLTRFDLIEKYGRVSPVRHIPSPDELIADRQAVGVVRDIQRILSPDQWIALRDANAWRRHYEQRGWEVPATYLRGATAQLPPNGGKNSAAALRAFLLAAPTFQRNALSIEADWDQVEANLRAFREKSQDPLVPEITRLIESGAGATLDLKSDQTQHLTTAIRLSVQLADVAAKGKLDAAAGSRLKDDMSFDLAAYPQAERDRLTAILDGLASRDLSASAQADRKAEDYWAKLTADAKLKRDSFIANLGMNIDATGSASAFDKIEVECKRAFLNALQDKPEQIGAIGRQQIDTLIVRWKKQALRAAPLHSDWLKTIVWNAVIDRIAAPSPVGEASALTDDAGTVNWWKQFRDILDKTADDLLPKSTRALQEDPFAPAADLFWKRSCSEAASDCAKKLEPGTGDRELLDANLTELKRCLQEPVAVKGLVEFTDPTSTHFFQIDGDVDLKIGRDRLAMYIDGNQADVDSLVSRRDGLARVMHCKTVPDLLQVAADNSAQDGSLLWACWLRREQLSSSSLNPQEDLRLLAAVQRHVRGRPLNLLTRPDPLRESAAGDVVACLASFDPSQESGFIATRRTLFDSAEVSPAIDLPDLKSDAAVLGAARFNAALHALKQSVKRGTVSIDALRQFQAETERSRLGDDLFDRISALRAKLDPAAPNVAASQRGPTTGPAVRVNPGNRDEVIYSISFKPGASYFLHFKKVPSRAGSVYLCTSEMSVGLYVDTIEHFGKEKLAWSFMQIGDGDLDANRRLIATVDSWTIKRSADGTGDWIGYSTPLTPMQYVTPAASVYVASLLGCRLPTLDEWLAAMHSPDRDPDETAANTLPAADEAVRFRSVPNRAESDSTFHDLGGNVSEWIWLSSTPLYQIDADSGRWMALNMKVPFEGSDSTPPLSEFSRLFGRIGQSRLRNTNVPVPVGDGTSPSEKLDRFRDVGFRLAFDAGTVSQEQIVLVDRSEYVSQHKGLAER